uniref:SRCR domain-containing protein n=1 Tax=Sphaeramia orbicularis TaxID=375764 RepID=A0A673BYR3_9TELE
MDHTPYVLVFLSISIQGLLSENNNTSTESVHFRLVGRASRCHGDLEMKWQDENWKPVAGYYWYRKLGNRVCAELDCGSAVSLRHRNTGSHKDSWWIRSEWDESALSDGFVSETHLSSSLELSCSDSVRLVRGSNVCSGRLEVWSNQSRSWSSVCEGHLDLHGAQVVCRELGCGAPGLLQGALYGEAEAPVVQTFQCEGHESALLDCGSSESQTCSSGTAVDLTCTDPDDVRLVGGASRCNGTVQVKYHGEWRDMGYDSYYYDLWTLKVADVICRRLDCGSAISGRTSGPSGPLWVISPICLLSTSTLMDCIRRHPDSSGSALFLTCSDSVTHLIIRVVLIVPALLIFDISLFFYYKVRSHLSSVDPLDFRLSHTHRSLNWTCLLQGCNSFGFFIIV